ncbi:unnamed protein product [Paramecium octaurelia]|uniref:Transmembrane protein n=1 Tax=Paramecium octaurelia TaxID=43137 RepID=A0A8S1TZT3_PAROT|nr:unnamed protein product [Paramecium octaurelia]
MRGVTLILIIYRALQICAYYIYILNDDNQIVTQELQINLDNFEIDSFFGYGVWSRYAPLGDIAQIGTIGILDSNCFHLHNAVSKSTQDLNLIVYDCLNYETQTIVRKIQFVTIDENWHKFELQLDNQNFEYVWHYFQITQWPKQKRFELLIIQYPQIKLQQLVEDILYPYKDTNLILTFGGGLQIISQNTIQILDGISQFSFYPGTFLLYPLSFDINHTPPDLVISTIQFRAQCFCISNWQTYLQDQVLTQLDKIQFTSQNPNCNTFSLTTWIKITNVHKTSQDFLYQIMKLSANFEIPQLVDDNLAAFQLFYKITEDKTQLIYTTYSYTFPLVSLNFQDDPFLIKKEFDLTNDFTLWHFVQAILSDNQLSVSIIFYGNFIHYEYKSVTTVNQFHLLKFKLQYGNLLQNSNDYLSVSFVNTYFSNCFVDFMLPEAHCHNSCEDCDGPTSSNCLSCYAESNRIFKPAQKSCVCPYNTIDDQQCKDFQSYNALLVQDNSNDQKCLQGYFQLEEKCVKCPSIISSKAITCLECYQFPQTWANNASCKTSSFNNLQGTVTEYLQTAQLNYIYDGDDLIPRYGSDSVELNEDVIDEFELASKQFRNFCFQDDSLQTPQKDKGQCYNCAIKGCIDCLITTLQTKCFKCDYYTNLEDGICKGKPLPGQTFFQICRSPYYLTSTYQCILCGIENCQYCFEYLSNDLTQCTLYKQFQSFNIDDSFHIGCALCKDGFIFDFTTGVCNYQKPQIFNCLRSYINLQGQEICTLSKEDNFNVAPEIINCNKYILNCKQCLQTPSKVIKCILCEDGYSTSVSTGQCDKCSIEHAKICIEGDYHLKDEWVQLIQSFLMQFLPNQYLYPKPEMDLLRIQFAFECYPNYKPNYSGDCIKYCDPDCLQCAQTQEFPYFFYCVQCPLNYYKLPIISSESGNCMQCPQLCQLCQSRTEQEIKNINPYFIVTDELTKYTYKCLQKAPDNNIVIDPYSSIAKYCENSICTSDIQYEFNIDCDNSQFILQQQFPEYYGTQIQLDYINQLGGSKLTIVFNFLLISEWFCQLSTESILENSFKQKIFSLQKVQVKLIGNDQSNKAFTNRLVIQNFDIVQILNMSIFTSTDEYIYTYLSFENYQDPIDLIITNTTFYGNIDLIAKYEMKSTKSGDCIFNNVNFMYLNLNNSLLYQHAKGNYKNQIQFTNIVILNSVFHNSVLFQFVDSQQDIRFKFIYFVDCKFYNSTIFNFQSSTDDQINIYIDQVSLINNEINFTTFVQNTYQSSISIRNILFSQNKVYNSRVLILTNNLLIQNTLFDFNKLIDSSFLFYHSQQRKLKDIQIQTLKILINEFTNSSVINLQSIDINDNVQVTMSNLELYKNIRNLNSEQLYLFILTCSQIVIQDCVIAASKNMQHFKLYDTQSIMIENMNYLNEVQSKQVPLSIECDNSEDKYSQLIYISGFYKLVIQKIFIQSQFTIDYSFVHIISNILYQPHVQEIIEIKDVVFQGNILLKQHLGSIFSSLLIYSEKSQEIRVENITFEENFFNEQIDDPSQTSAGLLFINSQQSSVFINNITCLSNALTNSSNSFIFINSISVQIQYITIKNHNNLNYQIWEKYYTIPPSSQNNQEEINLIISSLYTIQSKGGAMSLTSSNINIALGQFTQVTSQSSSIFDIKTQGLGIVQLNQLYINQAEVDLVSTTETQGCISIYSKNSQLNLQIKNVQFYNVFNRQSSSIFSIIPSQKYNKIDINDVILENCLSLNNQFMKIEFSLQKQDQNLVTIQNLLISQNYQHWKEYFNKLNPISLSEINKVVVDNALINLNGCQLLINRLISEGIFISPILKIVDSQSVQIKNCKINSIQTFYSFNIFYLGQTKIVRNSLFLEDVEIKNVTILQLKDESSPLFENFQIKFNVEKCSILRSSSLTQTSSSESFQSILQYLNYNISSQGSLIYIQSISNENSIILRVFSLIKNNYSRKLNGLIYFDISGFQILKIVEVNCIQNKIDSFGCLNFIANKNLENKIQLMNSKFILNSGMYGSAIYAKQVIIFIKHCQFLQNIAREQGGAIYFENCSNNFRIIHCLILDNYAKEGGGIYFNGINQINKNNINDSLIKLNIAEKFTDNIVEQPHHLALIINSFEMLSSQERIENQTTNVLQLNSYKTIEQGQLLKTNQLYLPSNQQILSFKLFNQNQQGFLSYFYEFSLEFQNSINEKVTNFQNFTCNLQTMTQTQSNKKISDPLPIQVLPYDLNINSYDLKLLSFTFDPYQNADELLLVSINCSTQLNVLKYIFTAKTYKCQLGEFYVSNGCQVCQPTQGFYSVTYNATKCSIFDKTKFQNITSNKIQLLEGFWRPNILSDQTEQCVVGEQETAFVQQATQVVYVRSVTITIFKEMDPILEFCRVHHVHNAFIFYLVYYLFFCPQGILQILLTLRSIDRTNQLFSSLKLKQKFGKILFKLNQDHESILIKMLLNYLWIFSIIFSFNITFSFSFDFVDQTCNTSFFMANSLDCYLIQIYNTEVNYSRIITQFILIFIQQLIIFGGFQVHSIATKTKFNNSILSNTALYLYLSNFAAIIKQFFSLLSKRTISNMEYIQGNVSLEFNTQSHYLWIYFFILPGLTFIGCFIPFILFFLMFLMRKKLDVIKIRRHICYMFNEYNDESFFWEFVKIWKKTILIGILTYFESNIFLKATLIGLCLLFYQLLAFKIKPYIIKSLNLLDISTDQICSITIFLAAVKYVSEQQENQAQQVLLQILISILCIKLCYPFIYDIFRVYYKKYKIKYLNQLIKIMKFIKPNSYFHNYLNQQLVEWKDKEVQLQKNFSKLKQYLFNVSKPQSEQKNFQSILSPSITLRNRLVSKENETKRFLIQEKE